MQNGNGTTKNPALRGRAGANAFANGGSYFLFRFAVFFIFFAVTFFFIVFRFGAAFFTTFFFFFGI